jgi:hypothetical protein
MSTTKPLSPAALAAVLYVQQCRIEAEEAIAQREAAITDLHQHCPIAVGEVIHHPRQGTLKVALARAGFDSAGDLVWVLNGYPCLPGPGLRFSTSLVFCTLPIEA